MCPSVVCRKEEFHRSKNHIEYENRGSQLFRRDCRIRRDAIEDKASGDRVRSILRSDAFLKRSVNALEP